MGREAEVTVIEVKDGLEALPTVDYRIPRRDVFFESDQRLLRRVDVGEICDVELRDVISIEDRVDQECLCVPGPEIASALVNGTQVQRRPFFQPQLNGIDRGAKLQHYRLSPNRLVSSRASPSRSG